MKKPPIEGKIHGIPVVIVRIREEARVRALREFIPLDAYRALIEQGRMKLAHEWEIGALFDLEAGTYSRRVVVRRMDRRAVFTDEQLEEMHGPEKAREMLAKEQRSTVDRRHVNRHKVRREAIASVYPEVCDACEKTAPVVFDGRGSVCTSCNTALVMVGDSVDRLKRLIGYVEKHSHALRVPAEASQVLVQANDSTQPLLGHASAL